jgi:predicted nucleic acid-binding protein
MMESLDISELLPSDSLINIIWELEQTYTGIMISNASFIELNKSQPL